MLGHIILASFCSYKADWVC